MSEISILGELRAVSLVAVKEIFSQLVDPKSIQTIENGNVLIYEEKPFNDISANEPNSFYLTGRYYGDLKACVGIIEKGLSDSEIVQIEMDYNVRLPVSYKQFLKQFGKSSGKILTSYLMTVDKMRLNRESALDASFDEIDNVKVEISDNYFFIGQWQGYNFYYLDCSIELEDPPVFILTDSPKTYKYKSSFTEFIKDEGLKPLLESEV